MPFKTKGTKPSQKPVVSILHVVGYSYWKLTRLTNAIKKSDLCTTLNCIFWWGSISRALGSVVVIPSFLFLPYSLWLGAVVHISFLSFWRCPWCNGYRRRKWTQWHEFKSWTRLIAFHIALIPLGKVWLQLFSLQLWVNKRTDWVLQPRWDN